MKRNRGTGRKWKSFQDTCINIFSPSLLITDACQERKEAKRKHEDHEKLKKQIAKINKSTRKQPATQRNGKLMTFSFL